MRNFYNVAQNFNYPSDAQKIPETKNPATPFKWENLFKTKYGKISSEAVTFPELTGSQFLKSEYKIIPV